MVSFKGAHFVQDIILTCVRWYPGLSLELPSCRRTDAGTWGVGGPLHDQPVGPEIQPPVGRGIPSGSVTNFDFRGKIEKLALGNSMTYRRQNSRKSNFATEPLCDRTHPDRPPRPPDAL
jgi:hypothetical protein